MTFGDYLKNQRKNRNITQEDLAKSLGVSSVFIHQLETGKVDAPSVDRCQQLSNIINIPFEQLWNFARKERMRRFMEREGLNDENLEVLSEEEKMLISLYRSLDDDLKNDFSGMIYMLFRHSKDHKIQEILEKFMKCA
jgi:transcriptional regulator with XRE-family HTH domain